MSPITTVGSWEATDVTAGEVEAAISSLRHHQARAAVRANVLTLVVVVDTTEEAIAALATVHELETRHPSRTVVCVAGAHEPRPAEGTVPPPSGRSGRDASVKVHSVQSGDRAVAFEDVVLNIRGQGRHHLDSVVEPFTLPDVPLVVWLPARLPAVGDPLMAAANRVVVDSRALAEQGTGLLARSAVLVRRLPVADLSWVRLAPWRRLLAGLFEGRMARPFAHGVEQVEVAGNEGPRHLLGGWLLERLRLEPSQVRLQPATHVSVTIDAAVDGRKGRFSVLRTGEERVLKTCMDISGGPHVEQVVRMGRQWPAQALAGALTQTGHDPLFEEALFGALRLREPR